MNLALPILTDLASITVLAYALYFRRHRRRDLLLAYTALNVGVLAVTISLSSVEVGIGIGIGLFGILSIIRLRSDQITQQEIAYYFVSLTLGLLAGLNPSPAWIVPALSGLLLLTMAIVDSPRLAARSRRIVLTLDRAILDERELKQELEHRLVAQVNRHETLQVDTVRDVTVVDVRYRLPKATSSLLPSEHGRRMDAAGINSRAEQAAAFRVPVTPGASVESSHR